MKTIGFIGLGLIGGSIARAVRRAHPDYYLLAYNRTAEALSEAIRSGVIDTACEEYDSRFSGCDIIFLCAPVDYNIRRLADLKNILRPGSILTDVGSVKGPIHEEVERLGMGASFIGGHPMAGSEKTGFSHSSDRLLENAYYLLTPGDNVPLGALADFTDLISSLGALPMVVSCQEHDLATAGVSHLPHLIASSLVNLVHDSDDETQLMKTIAAGGFRDITRIASSSPDMWQQICRENAGNITRLLDDYILSLVRLRSEMEAGNHQYVYDMFEASRNYRDSIDLSDKGLISMSYRLFVDLADEPGGIAAITTLLAMEGINIRNLAIIHNREFEEGVMKLEFYDQPSMDKAKVLLEKRNYIIHA